jgi:hypothetical protein
MTQITRETHVLKTWPEFFALVWAGYKTAELRRDDRGFQIGDRMELREYDPESRSYTGRKVVAEITHVVRDAEMFGLMPGFAMLSFRIIRTGEARP